MLALPNSTPHGTIRCSTRALIAGLLVGVTSIISAQAQSKALIGRWITGPADLADKSAFTPAGKHDGVAIGTIPSNVTFESWDVPPGWPTDGSASCLSLLGDSAVLITNTATSDSAYTNTFDNGISNKFTMTLWFKGQPGNWNPFVSKAGESAGWQVRRFSGDQKQSFTIRGSTGGDDMGDGTANSVMTDFAWHQFVAVWDGVRGTRKLFVDGALHVGITGDFAPMNLATLDHLILGGRQGGGGTPGNFFTGKLADVRVYNYPMSSGEAMAFYNGLPTTLTTHVDANLTNCFVTDTVPMDVIVPADATASSSYTVTLTSSATNVMGFQGVTGDTMTLTFAQGVNITNIILVANGAGAATVTASGAGYSDSVVDFTVYAQNPPALVGQWLTGAADLQDKSAYTSVGTHDGFAVGTNAGAETFSSDLPPGAAPGGQSLNLPGNVAIAISNSVSTAGGYLQTFDANVAKKQSLTFWAKGVPGGWQNWVSKSGEDGTGYHINQHGTTGHASYGLRGTGGPDDVEGTKSVTDGLWHHYAGTYDGVTGVRKLYVDGTLQYTVSNDFGPMAMAPTNHLVLGGIDRHNAGFQAQLIGKLYDVRLYNYPITAQQVTDIAFPGIGLTAVSSSVMVGKSNTLTITIPSTANLSTSVTLFVTNTAPTIADLPGAVSDVLTVTFAIGQTPSTNIAVAGLAIGTASYSAGSSVLGSSSTQFSVVRTSRTLLGHWFVGNEDYIDYSGWQTNIHNGTPWGFTAFSTDVPPGFTGSSLDLSTAQGAVVIDNSYTAAGAGYTNTFDDSVKNEITIAFWNKGWVNGTGPSPEWWNGHFVSKNAQDWETGYSMRPFVWNNNKMDFELGVSGLWWGDEPSIASKDTTTWHHYVGTLDTAGKVKTLYVDGKLSQSRTGFAGASINMAKNSALVIGGLDKNTGGTDITHQTSSSKFYDVRVYGKALSHYEAYALANAGVTNISMSGFGYPSLLVGATSSFSISLPNGYNTTNPFTVYLTNDSPGVVSINGSTAAVIAITFPAGALPFTNVSYSIIGSGTANLSLGGAGMQTVATTTEAIVPALVGRWVSGAANLQDISGYTPAGTHDGTTMGATPSFYKFSPDVPPGFTGYSLDLTTNGQNCYFEDGSPMTNENGSQIVGQVAVPIGNSANNAPGYRNTFDNPLSVSCTISFWAQGVPGGWQPFVAKHGEDGVGYQVRRGYGEAPAFTVRGTSNQDGVGYGDITTNAAWYHVAAVRDAVTGIRKLYVNGVLHLNLTGDTAVGTLAPGQRFVIGGMERNGWTSGYFSGMLYDVRVYNYPLNQTQVNALLVPEIPVPTLGIQAAANGQIVISWPTASTGYVLQTNMALPGVWGNSTLPVSVVGSMNTVTNTVGAGANFYRLIK